MSPSLGMRSRVLGRAIVQRARGMLPVVMHPTRVGLAISDDRWIRAVGVRGGRVRWHTETTLDTGVPLEDGLVAFFTSMNASAGRLRPRWLRWRRSAIVVALPSQLAQLKRLTGLPPLADRALLASLVREGADRFFLRGAGPLAVGGVRLDEEGGAWAAAYDSTAVAGIDAACRATGWRIHRIVPAAAALPHALLGERICWTEGAWTTEVRVVGSLLSGIRRQPATEETLAESAATLTAVPALAVLGDGARRFAAAYGAAESMTEPVGLAGGAIAHGDQGPTPRWRLALAAAAVLLAAVGGAIVPVHAARRAAERATAELATLAVPRAQATATERELRRETEILAEADELQRGRRSMTELLASITMVLPESTALASLRVDSVAGTLVVVGQRVAHAAGALEHIPDVASAELVGPVTRESVAPRIMAPPYGPAAPGGALRGVAGAPAATAGHELERATIRIRLRPRSHVVRSDTARVRP